MGSPAILCGLILCSGYEKAVIIRDIGRTAHRVSKIILSAIGRCHASVRQNRAERV
jgi:hypothetical protein